MKPDIDQLLKDIEIEAQLEGTHAMAELRALDAYFEQEGAFLRAHQDKIDTYDAWAEDEERLKFIEDASAPERKYGRH